MREIQWKVHSFMLAKHVLGTASATKANPGPGSPQKIHAQRLVAGFL